MSDEEIISLNRMKLFARSSDLSVVTAKDMEIVVNLIETQQKEIEELNKKIQRIYDTQRMIDISDINKSHISFN